MRTQELLKLYIYRAWLSCRLEAETHRNIEMIWLAAAPEAPLSAVPAACVSMVRDPLSQPLILP